MPPRSPFRIALLFAAVSLAPQAVAQQPVPSRPVAPDRTTVGDDDSSAHRTAMSERSEPDDPAEMEQLTRELWTFARRTPYAVAVRHAADVQARTAATAQGPTLTLPTGWRIAPPGHQVAVGRLPYEAIPFARRIAVLNGGWYPRAAEEPAISIVEVARGRVDTTLHLPSLYPSATVAGASLVVSGGSSDSVFVFDSTFANRRAYDVGGYVGPVAALDATHVAVALLVAPDSVGATGRGRLEVLDLTTGDVRRVQTAGWFPSAMLRAGTKLYVTLVGEHHVAVFDVAGGSVRHRATIAAGTAPQALCADDTRLYVVNSGSDDIAAVSLGTDSVVGRFAVRFPGAHGESARFGSAPTSCAISGKHLYVTASGMNATAVFDRTAAGATTPLGFIPAGWYPTKVVARDGRLLVLSAKGIRARHPNRNGPQAVPQVRHSGPDYVLSLLDGSLGILPEAAVDTGLRAWTTQVGEGSPLYSARQGLKLPIKYVFYVVRENRSYDQVLGDLGRGNADSSLTLFPDSVTPAAHQLAREFVTLDNFFADGEISVLGHSFTTSGYASPFLEWLGNATYAGRYNGYPFGTAPAAYSPAYLWDALEAKHLPYRIYGEPYYLFTRLYRLISERYGIESAVARRFYAHSMALSDSVDRGARFTALGSNVVGRASTHSDAEALLNDSAFAGELSRIFTGDSTLARALRSDAAFRGGAAEWLTHYMLGYPAWDLAFSDLDRVALWKSDFERALRSNSVPSFSYLWLPNDHTAGMNSNFLNPFQLVAQNDAALGQLVATISHSSIWRQSLIIVMEDDAQNGPDHVDATRTVGLLAGPYVRRNAVVNDRYDQLSAMRTAELLLGLDPLNLDDALAVPMFNALTTKADGRAFTAARASPLLVPEDRARLERLTRP
jgi:DNA-binding beta-propeller fold protein YncE